jgi:hypothetical protein
MRRRCKPATSWGAQSLAGSHAAAFEVASIRPNSVWKAGGEGNSRSKIEFTPDRLTMRNVWVGKTPVPTTRRMGSGRRSWGR